MDPNELGCVGSPLHICWVVKRHWSEALENLIGRKTELWDLIKTKQPVVDPALLK
jgi:hypothetical protein